METTFKILRRKKTNIFRLCQWNEFKELRKIMITNILATDMKEHFTLCKKFETRIKECQNKDEYGKENYF